MRVKIGDVVDKIVGDEDRLTTSLKYYVGGEHISSSRIKVYDRGLLDSDKGKTLGYQFHYPFKERDVLFMTKNPYLKKCGMVDFEGICSIATFVMRSKDEGMLLQEYLAIVMQTDSLWNYLEANKSGSVNYFITWKTLENYEFELPDIEEQKRISRVVWQAEKTRNSYERLLSETDVLLRSRFNEMFGDLEKNTKKYPIKKLSEVAEYFNGLTYKPEDVTQDGNGILVLRSSNIQNGSLAFEDNVRVSCDVKEKLMVKDNDILMCSRNGSAALVGKTALIKALDEPMTFGAFMMIVRSQYYPYLKTFFDTNTFRKQLSIGTTTINQITGKMLNDVKVPLPDLDTVYMYGEFLEQSDTTKAEIQRTIDHLANTIRALILQVG